MKHKREILRQAIHATGIIFVIIQPWIGVKNLILLGILAAFMGEIIRQYDLRHSIPLFSWLLRTCRRDTNERGFIYYFIGLALTYAFFGSNIPIANAAIIILTIGDAASTLIGKLYGKHPLPYKPNKTFEGSIAFIFIGFIGALTQVNPTIALMGAFIGSLVEAYTPIEDNITIPLLVGISMYIFFYLNFI
ncbi:MAG: phosphatidate cytidylyltransferase [Methanothermobacter sp.]|nr:phosphatidate cytidylyltransferase [Methanothermobacter sp.]